MKRNGFSLIELLVVISIIASIVALAIPNYLGARQRAQDIKKKEEMTQFKNALRLYYNDFNKYPCGTATCIGAGNGMAMFGCGTEGALSCATTCTPGFASGAACDTLYMKQLPTGFLVTPITIKYWQSGTFLGDDFCLQTTLNNLSDPDIATSQSRCTKACGANCTGSGRYCVCAD